VHSRDDVFHQFTETDIKYGNKGGNIYTSGNLCDENTKKYWYTRMREIGGNV
jgi:hypothetical protein